MSVQPVNVIVFPKGLIKGRSQSIDNIDLRVSLEKAVNDADLNVTERMALNEKFFPNGGGFELFPKGKENCQFSLYPKSDKLDEKDVFLKEINEVNIPDDIAYSETLIIPSKEGTFNKNLENALKKLSEALKGKI